MRIRRRFQKRTGTGDIPVSTNNGQPWKESEGDTCSCCAGQGCRGHQGPRHHSQNTVNHLIPEQKAKIIRVRGRDGIRQRLMDLGFMPGTIVRMVRAAPLQDPIELQIDNAFVSVRRAEASRIEIAIRN